MERVGERGRCAGMIKLFDRAESCRSRATELRELAAKVREPEARTTLVTMADMLEEHAHTLEAVAIKFGVARRAVMREAAD
jgi:hypothetical protein